MAGQMQAWPTGLCGCFEDCGSCCCGYWCHVCQFGQFASKMDEGSCFGQCCLYYLSHMCCLQGCVAGPKRAKLRGAHGLPAEPCGDCCVHTFCSTCAVCQEMRVIKTHGAAPAQAVFVTGPAYAPPPPQDMGGAYPPPPQGAYAPPAPQGAYPPPPQA